MKELCEKTAARSITVPTLGRLLLLSNSDSTSAADDAVLRTACVQFVNENRSTLLQDASFRAEVFINYALPLHHSAHLNADTIIHYPG